MNRSFFIKLIVFIMISFFAGNFILIKMFEKASYFYLNQIVHQIEEFKKYQEYSSERDNILLPLSKIGLPKIDTTKFRVYENETGDISIYLIKKVNDCESGSEFRIVIDEDSSCTVVLPIHEKCSGNLYKINFENCETILK